MLDALAEIAGLERLRKLDAVVADTHELHPETLAHARAVVPLFRDGLLIPRARLLLARKDFADPTGEAAPLGLDEMAHDLVCAPLLRVEVPPGVIAKGFELGLDESSRGLEVLGDLVGRELRRGVHVTSCGALRIGIFTFSTTLPSARASCVDSP